MKCGSTALLGAVVPAFGWSGDPELTGEGIEPLGGSSRRFDRRGNVGQLQIQALDNLDLVTYQPRQILRKHAAGDYGVGEQPASASRTRPVRCTD